MALDGLGGAGKCRVSMATLVQSITSLLDNAQLLIYQVLQLL